MVFSPGGGSNEERSSESRRDSASQQGIPPELSNLINQVLATERIGPLRRGISCYARPTYAVGSRQMQSTCTMILKDGKPVCRGAGAPHLPRSNGVSWACVARNTPPERSKPLSGENLIYQVRELRRNLLRSCAVPVGSRNFVPRPLAVEPPTGERT